MIAGAFAGRARAKFKFSNDIMKYLDQSEQ